MEQAKSPMLNDVVIQCQHLHKCYATKTVINDFNYTFRKGKVYLLTAGNGQGKSTLLKMMLGLIKGEGITNFYAHHISYVPEKINLPAHMNSYDYLDILGSIKGLDEQERAHHITLLATLFNFNEGLHHPMKELSKGMKQKVLLIGAFLREDDIYILDEALNGLDEYSVHQLLNLIQEKKAHATFIIVTHEKDVYEGIYDEIVGLD